VLLCSILCSAALAVSPVSDFVSDAVLADTLSRFNAVARAPLPELSAHQRQNLLGGSVLKLLVPQTDGTLRVVGLILTDQTQRRMWLSTQDPHFSSSEAIEAPIYQEDNRASWYAMLDLPRPVKDRHWVIQIWDNVALAKSSGGEFWEHPWRLDPDGVATARPLVERGEVAGLSLEAFDAALYTPVNHGAMVFIALPYGYSLMAYDVTSVVGGNIPDRLVAEFVRAGMERSLREVETRAREVVPGHYRGGHAPVLGANGEAVPLFP
jgi:hypothetical protein